MDVQELKKALFDFYFMDERARSKFRPRKIIWDQEAFEKDFEDVLILWKADQLKNLLDATSSIKDKHLYFGSSGYQRFDLFDDVDFVNELIRDTELDPSTAEFKKVLQAVNKFHQLFSEQKMNLWLGELRYKREKVIYHIAVKAALKQGTEWMLWEEGIGGPILSSEDVNALCEIEDIRDIKGCLRINQLT